MSKSINLQDHIKTNTAGIIWITKEKLSHKLNLYNDLNYFFNGLITQYLKTSKNKEKNDGINFFISNNFNDSFFLGHLTIQTNNLQDYLKNLILLINNKNWENMDEILVIDSASCNALLSLEKLKTGFNFKQFF